MARTSPLGGFELIVMLGLIRLGAGSSGIPIAREIELQTGREVALSSLYFALQRLEDKGYITSMLGDPTPKPGGRAKRYFSPTKKGLEAVRETRRILMDLWAGHPELEQRNRA